MDAFSKFTYWVAATFFVMLVLAGFCMLFALPTYLLWNWIMPEFGLPELSIWQSFGLMMLCNILFGNIKCICNIKFICICIYIYIYIYIYVLRFSK